MDPKINDPVKSNEMERIEKEKKEKERIEKEKKEKELKNKKTNSFEYIPYEDQEFPVWTQKLRRGEIIFFGSMALSFPLVVLAYNLSVDKFGAKPIEDDNTKVLVQMGAAACVAFTISLTDFIIGEVNGE